MADHANVTSVDALDAFRSKLITFLEKATLSLNEVSEEVARTRSWLQGEQRVFWESQIRRLNRELEDARQRLFSAELSAMRETSSGEEREMKRSREKLRNSEDKLRATKKWNQMYESAISTESRKVESLRSILTHEMPQAIAFLTQAIQALDSYAGMSRSGLKVDNPAPEEEDNSNPDAS